MSTSPIFPIELIEAIISEAWNTSLSTDERISMMTSSPLVSTAYMLTFTRVSSKHVHIPSQSYANHYFRVLCVGSRIYDKYPDIRLLCGMGFPLEHPYARFAHNKERSLTTSITFHDTHNDCALYDRPLPMMMRWLTMHASFLPNLRAVRFAFADWAKLRDMLHRHPIRFKLPKQVTQLVVAGKASAVDPGRPASSNLSFLSIKTLIISPSIALVNVQDIVDACPNAVTIVQKEDSKIRELIM